MKIFGGPKKPRRVFQLNQFGADRHMDERHERAIGARDIIRYTHMPEILPRIRALGQKFGHFAFMLALIFRSARLLPASHPMLNPVNIGRFGMRDVIATAANNVVIKRENIDQIIVFGAVVTALLMVAIQIVLIALAAMTGNAHAQAANIPGTGMFSTPSPNTDLVFQFLRQVFGVADIYGSLGSNAIAQPGLYAILGFYSTAMMIVASLIIVYYVIVVVGEAAQSGKPFGGRFNSLWAPIRLVIALGLLVPLGGGLNSAQYLVLYIAKMSSGFATQGWRTYTDNFNMNTLETTGVAGSPSVEALVKQVFASEACRALYLKVRNSGRPMNILAVYDARPINGATAGSFKPTFTNDVSNVLQANGANLKYVWTLDAPGTPNPKPLCGAISFTLHKDASADDKDFLYAQADQISAQIVGAFSQIISRAGAAFSGSDFNTSKAYWSTPNSSWYAGLFAEKYTESYSENSKTLTSDEVFVNVVQQAINVNQTFINERVSNIKINDIRDPLINKMKMDAGLRGWGAAGIYYMTMAKAHQAIMNAIYESFPKITPAKSEIYNEKSGAIINEVIWDWGQMPRSEQRGLIETEADKELRVALDQIGPVLSQAVPSTWPVDYRGRPDITAGNSLQQRINDDPVAHAFLFLFGPSFTRLLDEPSLSPMATLVQAGNDVLTRSFNMLIMWGIASGFKIAVGWVPILGTIADLAAGIAGFLTFIGFAVGIVLFYVLPLMPFMYFFFAVVNWVIEVAEAFISMPLFALAHLRIDGDGLPGQTAFTGYMTLFGVFLRPLLIVFGLIISSLIFGAATYYLAIIFKSVIFSYQSGANGVVDYNKLNPLDILMFMVLFVYMIYLLANSTFKLIDKIPDEAMRWIGGGRGFTGDRPVELGNMQGMALAGYAGVKQGFDALNSGTSKTSQAIQAYRKDGKEKSAEKAGITGNKGPEDVA